MQRRKLAECNAAYERGMRDPDNISAIDAISGGSTRISLRLNRYLLQRSRLKAKAAETRRLFKTRSRLQRGFDLESPGFQERLRNVFRVFIAPCPFAEAS